MFLFYIGLLNCARSIFVLQLVYLQWMDYTDVD